MKIYGSEVTGPGGRTLPFSSALEVDGLLFLSGQMAIRNGKVEGDVIAQSEIVLDSIAALLKQAGLTLDHVIKATVWLSDGNDYAAFNSVYSARFTAPYPARSCVISQLVLADARVEIEVVASRNHTRT